MSDLVGYGRIWSDTRSDLVRLIPIRSDSVRFGPIRLDSVGFGHISSEIPLDSVGWLDSVGVALLGGDLLKRSKV